MKIKKLTTNKKIQKYIIEFFLPNYYLSIISKVNIIDGISPIKPPIMTFIELFYFYKINGKIIDGEKSKYPSKAQINARPIVIFLYFFFENSNEKEALSMFLKLSFLY